TPSTGESVSRPCCARIRRGRTPGKIRRNDRSGCRLPPVQARRDPEMMGKRPRTRFRSLDGLLLLDKPAGLSSNQAMQRARHIFRALKAGHTGSLAPLATGLLRVCLGEATKIGGLLLGGDKADLATAVLGATTDADDADGAVLRDRPVPSVDNAAIEAAMA